MTAPPPPPPHYPPPPAQPAWVLPKEAYTPWPTRVLAFLVDIVPIVTAFLVIPLLGMLVTGETGCFATLYGDGRVYGHVYGYDGCSRSGLDFWIIYLGVAILLTPIYVVWNLCYRQGRTGSSLGKSVCRFTVVSENTWQPIGFWKSVVRQLTHYIDTQVCFLGFFWPLWDKKRQTIADMVVHTVCVPSPPPG